MKENERIELKKEFQKNLNKEIVAFANTKGGEIYLGINNDGTIVGLEDINDVELQCINHLSDTIKPDIMAFLKFEKVFLDKKTVLKITVNKGSMSPYYLSSKGIRPEGVYVRVGSASMPATETQILKMIKETTGTTYEEIRSLNQNLTFIQTEQEFFNMGISFNDSNKKTLGIIGRDGCYTNVGFLLSDQCDYKIKFAVYEGKQKTAFKDRHEFSGSLFRQFYDLINKIDSYNRLSSPKLHGMKRVDKSEYPKEAIREVVLNALIHRDYSLKGYTLVSMFENRMEVLSLGGLVKGVDMSDIMLGVSILRNKNLADVFYRLRFIEAYGTGIDKIKESYKNQTKKPLFESSPNAFKVTLPKLENEKSHTNKREEKIIKLIEEKEEITRSDVENLLKVSSSTATRTLTKMVEEEKIKRIGRAQSIKYIIKK